MKTIITVVVGIILFCTPVYAQDYQARALAENAPQVESYGYGLKDFQRLQAVSYTYGHIFTYQATNANWWTGLAVTNIATSGSNQIKVLVFNESGTETGEGTAVCPASRSQVVMTLSQFVTSGYVSEKGCVFVYGTGPFLASLFVGNNNGGFAIVDKESISF